MKKALIGCLALGLLACSRNKDHETLNCAAVDCLTATGTFFLKIVDAKTGENKIANGSFDTTGLRLLNGADQRIPVTNNTGIDSLKQALFFWDQSIPGNNKIQVTAKSGTISFTYQYTYHSSGCCGSGEVTNITVNEYPFSSYPLQSWSGKNIKIIEVRL